MTMTIAPSTDLADDIATACGRIAPTWPLDRFIAVNPYWGWRMLPAPEAAARLGVLAGTRLTMPRSWFRDESAAGRLDPRHVRAAAAASGRPELAERALAVLHPTDELPHPPLHRLALVTDLRDVEAGPVPGRSWTELVVHEIGQHCAAHFDDWQASWAPDGRSELFGTWRVDPSVTHGFRWRHGRRWTRSRLDALPDTARGAIATMLDDLGIHPSARSSYLTALLGSVNGWAAWCAYRRWQARLDGRDDDTIVDLLAIRVAWEWLLAEDLGDDERSTLRERWAASWVEVDAHVAQTLKEQRIDWILQDAVERTHQDTIIGGFPGASSPAALPDVQAVFCIDVRSEVFRRALEAESPTVHTRGFAGFFGLPIDYTPAGSALTRPQLPGLLAPTLHVTQSAPTIEDDRRLATRRATAHSRARRWTSFRTEPSSVFTFVETMGLRSAVELVADSVPHRHAVAAWEDDGLEADHVALRPRLALIDDDPAAAARLAHRVLTTMGLIDGFAPLVLLCGHGSTTTNNPHAAGLACGACGGQTGEVNARVLAELLDAPAVRRELASLGIEIPDTTWFVAGLHDTTTDAVVLVDADLAPERHRPRIDELAEWLRGAGRRSRSSRADQLGLAALAADPDRLEQRLVARSGDWSCVRPEWGLAGNAAFIVAPRQRTRHLDLGGRCFLHDYDWRLDPDLTVLTSIMTAPMVVTNWINLQYHASTVDNLRYGSGNKVLHNVVGGTVGVFEGNGGDLRIGLPMQSLHDGSELRHRPLRLSVFVEAPSSAIDAVIDGQAVVRDLVDGDWLRLLGIDPTTGHVERRTGSGWHPAC